MKRWSVCLASSRRRRTSAQQLPCAIGGLCVRVSLYLSRTLNHSLSLLEALSLSLSLSLTCALVERARLVAAHPAPTYSYSMHSWGAGRASWRG